MFGGQTLTWAIRDAATQKLQEDPEPNTANKMKSINVQFVSSSSQEPNKINEVCSQNHSYLRFRDKTNPRESRQQVKKRIVNGKPSHYVTRDVSKVCIVAYTFNLICSSGTHHGSFISSEIMVWVSR